MKTIRRILGFPLILLGAIIFQVGFRLLDDEMQETFAERFVVNLLTK
jgi:hypothetical protein